MTSKRLGMLIDLRCCAGCHACSVSCKAEHDVPLGSFRTRVEVLEAGLYPQVKKQFVPMMCNQCTDAPCITSCPTQSLAKNENGVVTVNKETCSGIGECVTSCPYDAIYLHPQSKIAEKCDFCSEQLDEGKLPSCVTTCPTNALTIGDLDHPASEIAEKIREHDVKQIEKENGVKPNVYYIGVDEEFRNIFSKISGINKDRKSTVKEAMRKSDEEKPWGEEMRRKDEEKR